MVEVGRIVVVGIVIMVGIILLVNGATLILINRDGQFLAPELVLFYSVVKNSNK
jgi:hypothetical protein